jgi:CHAT domain-containing protein
MIAQSLLRLSAVRGALLLGLTLAGGPALAADALVAVGDELAVGKNRTGETCRLRLVELRQDQAFAVQRYALLCEGWTQPSGEITRFNIGRGYTFEKLLTESKWWDDPAFGGAPGDTRSVVALAALCREGGNVDTELVRGLPRLRESAGELKQIARALQAPDSDVILGADASEKRVRQTDLSRYRVVAFATHGLLPAELKCKGEPALALTPPATADEDGLLDAGEVAQLKLDADWVVLSACNTAAPDGRLGGQSLSGLARAFFYAGARSLLVSHWAVASRPTVVLTTSLFEAYARDAGLGRANALRAAQLKLQADAATSHPVLWAPFVLVGDGGTP